MGDEVELQQPDDAQPDLLRVEPAYKNVLRARLAIVWSIVAIAAIVFDQIMLWGGSLHGLPTTLAPLIGLLSVALAPQRIYARLGYRLSEKLLRVVRGWMFHIDTVVPLVRVQHIDVVRGPLEKMFGTATLVVHTAGTHNSIVNLPGLSPQRASEIRDVIRAHVRTDFA